MQMQNEDEINLLDYWRVLIKRRKIAFAFLAVVVSLAILYSLIATPIYRGTTKILLELEKNPIMTFTEGGGATLQMRDASEYYQTQVEILTSRAFGDRVVKKLQLDKNPLFLQMKDRGLNSIRKRLLRLFSFSNKKDVADNPIIQSSIQEELDAELTSIILNNLEIEVGKGSSILKIHFYSINPAVAASMANGIAAVYIEHNLDIRVKPYRDAVEWLTAKMNESRSRLEDSEKAVQQYKEGKNIVSFTDKEDIVFQQLQELVTQLVQADAKKQEAEVRYRQIESVIKKPQLLATVPDIMNNPVIQGLRTQELSMKTQITELSQKYGPKHPHLIKARKELGEVQKNINLEAKKMLLAAKSSFEIARERESSLKRAIEDQKQAVLDLDRKKIEYQFIAGEATSNKQFFELLLKKLQEASLSSGTIATNAQIVDRATMPNAPVKPNRILNILVAIIVGTFGGIFLAFFVEYIDDTIKNPDDIENVLGLPFLGFVPATSNVEGPIFMFSGRLAAVAESFRTIRTSILLSTADEQKQKVILVTSTIPNEGKTTIAANLAVAMAQMGERVLLIDTDMRRHNLHRVFTVDNLIGISDMIVDHENTEAALRSLSQIPNLSVITGGTLAPNPSELLGSHSMKVLLDRLRDRFDRIILDSPPLMAFSDALVLSRLADGVVFVVWGNTTSRNHIRTSTQAIKNASGNVIGVVLNNVDMSSRSYSYYHPYYHYYYGEKKNNDDTNARERGEGASHTSQ